MKFEKNKKYKMPSGLGGAFSLRFIGEENGELIFRITNPDWQKEIRLDSKKANAVEPE